MYGEDGRKGEFSRPAGAFSASRGRKLLEAIVTGRAIDPDLGLGPVPEATATFANFQKYA